MDTGAVDTAGRRGWPVVLIGLALAYLPAWGPRVRDAADLPRVVPGPSSSILWNVLAVVALLVFVRTVERRDLSSLGIHRPSGKDMEWAMYLFGAHMAWTWTAHRLWPPESDAGTASITALPVLTVLLIVLTAAVCEEVLFRGYPIERLAELTGHRWIAVAVTLPVFLAPHLAFFGPQWLLHQFTGTLAIYVLFVWRRNLPAAMVLHVAVNLPVLIPTIAQKL